MTYHEPPRPQLRGVVYAGLLDLAVIRYGLLGKRRCLDAPEAHELAGRVVDVLIDAGLVAIPDDLSRPACGDPTPDRVDAAWRDSLPDVADRTKDHRDPS